MEWVSCGDKFIEADVIRWREVVWKTRRSRKARPRKIAERIVTAEVLKREPGGWVRLKITACDTTNAEDWPWTVASLKIGAVTRRQGATIRRGRGMRLLWSDESARRSITDPPTPPKSRFL